MKKIKIDVRKVVYREELCNFEKDVTDQFGNFGFYFRLYKCFTLSGIVYQVQVPNYTANDKNLYKLVFDTLFYIHEKGMRYDRLKEKLYSLKIWNTL